MNIYVGNLSRQVKEEELKDLFASYGETTKVNIIMDKFTGESRGFGFVEMPDKAEAETAISELDGKDVQGRTIKVSQAKPRTEKPRNGGFNRSGGGGYNRGGGNRDRGGFSGGNGGFGGGGRGGRY